MIFDQTQLQFLLWLKEIRGPILDGFFFVLAFFDTPYFYIGLLAAIWLGLSRKWGIRIAYLELASSLFNTGAKIYFALPRPCHVLPEICPFFHPKSFGFPSGGAQASFIIGGVLILFWKNRLAWPLGILYCLLISFSRMYLGVHYPIDVLGGWIQGAIVLTLFYFSVERIEKYANKHLNSMTALSIGAPLIAWCLITQRQSAQVLAATVGLGVGIYLSRRFHQIPIAPKTTWAAVIRALFGIVSTMAVLFFTESPFCVCLWISWISGLLLMIKR